MSIDKYKFKKQPAPPQIYEFNWERMRSAILSILIATMLLWGIDSLKQEKPLSERLDLRNEYAKMVLKAHLDSARSQIKAGKPDVKHAAALDPVIRELDSLLLPREPTWREQLGDRTASLHYVFDLGVAACVATITVCGLYLLYMLAHWLKIPGQANAPSPPAPKGSGTVTGLGAISALGSAGIFTAAGLITSVAAISGGLTIRHLDAAGTAPNTLDVLNLDADYRSFISKHFDSLHGPGSPSVKLEVTSKQSDQRVGISADSSWTDSMSSLNKTAIALSKASQDLVEYGAILKSMPQPASRQTDWDEVSKQLKTVAAGAESLLENSRIANQRTNLAMASLLGRDCHRQATEGLILKSLVGAESEFANLNARIQKQPCAANSQVASQH